MGEVKFGEILGPEDEILGSEEEASRAERVRGRFFATFRKAARYIPFADDLVAAYFCALDPRRPTASGPCCWRRWLISSCRPT